MKRLERLGWKAVGMLAIVVAIAAGVRYQDPLVRLAGHTPLIGGYVQQRFPGPFGDVEMPGHEHETLVDYWTCSMHPSVHLTEEGNCPICGMDLVPVYEAGSEPGGTGEASATVATEAGEGDVSPTGEDISSMPGMSSAAEDPGVSREQRATFTIDPSWQQAIAVTTMPVTRRRLTDSFRTVGVVAYDENRLVDVNLKLTGWISKLYVGETGQLVRAGEPLFDLYSPELVSTQREYLVAVQALERVAASPEPEIVERARSLVAATRRRLLLWDITDEQVDSLATRGAVVDAMSIVSPAGGYVVEKVAVEGMHVMPGMRLYRIADLDKVWVIADVYESELPFIEVGQLATIRLPYDLDKSWRARIDYVYPTLERQTRTVKVRLVVDNPELGLRPDMYADVVVERDAGEVLAVPRDAVLDFGTRKIAFVDLGGGRLQAREVAVGEEVGGFVAIRAGLEENELVVTSGHFLVDAESKVRGVVPLPVRGPGEGPGFPHQPSDQLPDQPSGGRR